MRNATELYEGDKSHNAQELVREKSVTQSARAETNPSSQLTPVRRKTDANEPQINSEMKGHIHSQVKDQIQGWDEGQVPPNITKGDERQASVTGALSDAPMNGKQKIHNLSMNICCLS